MDRTSSLKPARNNAGRDHSTRARAWSDDELHLLGALPDGDVADQVGRSRTAVRLKRIALGLRSPMRPGRPPMAGNSPRKGGGK